MSAVLQHRQDNVNSKLLVRYLRHGMNNGPFEDQTVLDYLNTDPHCGYCTAFFKVLLLVVKGLYLNNATRLLI